MKKKRTCVYACLVLLMTTHSNKTLPICSFLFPCFFTKEKKQKVTKESICSSLHVVEKRSRFDTTTKISFIYNATCIGIAHYNNSIYSDYGSDSEYLYLDQIIVSPGYRRMGLGKEFFRTTMQNIHQNHPTVEIVRWSVNPIGEFGSKEEYRRAQKNLHQFYTKLGAITDTKKHTAFINLKDAGYFK